MLTLTVTDYQERNIDIIKYTSIMCSHGYAKVDIEVDRITVTIDSDLCQIDELSEAHDTAMRLQKYGNIHMEKDYSHVNQL